MRSTLRSAWMFLKPVSDAALVVLSFGIAYWLRYELQWIRQVEPAYQVPFEAYAPSVASLTLILVIMYWVEGCYRSERGRGLFDEFYLVVRGSVTGIATMIVFVFLVTPSYYSRLIFGYTGLVVCLLLGASRALERAIVAHRRKLGIGVRRVLIVGAGEIARSIMRTVVARPELGYQIIGFLDDDPGKQTDIGRYPALGTTDRLVAALASQPVDDVFVTLPWVSHSRIMEIMQQCDDAGVSVRIVPDLFRITLSHVVVDNLDGIPLMGVRGPVLRDWQVVFKRVLDVLVSVVAMLVLAPLAVLLALAIKLDSPGPVVFRQTRVGRGGEEFTVLKFRSMRVDAEDRMEELRSLNESTGPLFKIRRDPRTTRIGRILRRMSLDELPQLWNVLKGDMTMVGPRPPLPAEVEQYAPWHQRRLEVTPGLTGLWQVSGRSDLTFDEMVLLDIYYVENWSPFLDLRILVKTVPTILFGAGAY